MLYRLQLSIFACALWLGSAHVACAAESFKDLTERAQRAWDRGSCQEASKAFADALKLANESALVASPSEQVRVALLWGQTLICLGQFDSVQTLGGLQTDSDAGRSEVQFILAEAAKGKGRFQDADTKYAEAVRLAGQGTPENDARRARFLAAWGDLGRLRGQFDAASSRLQQALAVFGTGDSIERATALVYAGDLDKDMDRWNDARKHYTDALAIAEAKGKDHPTAARAALGLGLIELLSGHLDLAETQLKRALNSSQALAQSTNYIESLDAMGLLATSKRDFKAGHDSFKACLDALNKVRGTDHPFAATVLDHEGGVLMAEESWDDAQAKLTSAENIERRTLGNDHPQLARTLAHRATVLRAQRKFQQATPLAEEALKILIAKLGPESLSVAATMDVQANLLSDQSNYAAAEALYRQSLKIEEKSAPPEAPLHLATMRDLALALHADSKDGEAGPLITQWMNARGLTLALSNPERIPVAVAIAESKLQAKNYPDAIKDLGDVLAANQALGKGARNLPIVHRDLGDALFATQKWKDAAREYEVALPGLPNSPEVGKVWQSLGDAQATQSLWADSIHSYQKALELMPKPDGGHLYLAMARANLEGGHVDQVAQYLDRWMTARNKGSAAPSPDEIDLLEKSAARLSAAKSYTQAENVLRFLLDAAKNPATPGLNVSGILLQLAETTEAEKKYAESAGLYEELASRNRAMRRFDVAEQNLQHAKTLREKDGGPKGADVVATLQALGEIDLLESKPAEARTAFEQARDILQKENATNDPRMAVSLDGLGAVLQTENPDEAAKLFDQAYELLKKSPNAPPRYMASVLYHLGSLKLRNNKITEATEYFTQCLSLSKGNFSAANPPPIEEFDQIAGAYERAGNFEEAEKQYKDNLEYRRSLFGANSIEEARGLYVLSTFYVGRKEYEKAADAGERALAVFEKTAGEESDEVAQVLNTLATVYRSKPDIDRAIAVTARSEQIQEKLGRPRGEINVTLSALGEFYREQKQYAKALEVYQKMATLWESDSYRNLNYQRAVLNIANQYVYMDKLPQGRDWFNKLQAALQRQHEDIQLTKARESFAAALTATGHEKEANKILGSVKK
ncbi:MAG TPA: tetratricopeptide repeat protein [Bryobacteraceae bacterium]|nr:tetratricopeptide repeat protein [Bryobacteraceae bacterium]